MKPTIGIVAPADSITQDDLDRALVVLKEEGFDVCCTPQITTPFGRMAGKDTLRAESLQNMAQKTNINAVIFAKGGYGSTRILPFIDWSALPATQIWLGFSDTTALLNARVAMQEQMGWHGPMLLQIIDNSLNADNKIALDILRGQPPISYSIQQWPHVEILQQGKVQGRLMGGNLSVFRSLLGTPYAPTPQKGDILFFEDICETNYRIDRDLEQIAQAGWFSEAGGIIWGRFSDIQDSTSRPFGFSLEDILARASARVHGPVICNAEVGHAGLNFPLPVGQTVTLEAQNTFTLYMGSQHE